MRDAFDRKRLRDLESEAFARKLASVAPDARAAWLTELESFQRECGCGSGAAGAFAGLALVIAWQSTHMTLVSLSAFAAAGAAALGVTILGGVAGKLLGLGRARVRFRRATHRLLAEVANSSRATGSAP